LFFDPGSELAFRHAPDLPSSVEEFEARLTADRAGARFAWEPYLHNPKLPRRLARVRQPVLVMWGAADRLLPPACAEAWKTALPHARVCIVPEAGHALGLERAEPAAHEIDDFLRATA